MMEVLDATRLADRLSWEGKEYWLHLESASPWEKYPAKQHARKVQEKLGCEQGIIFLSGQPARNNEDSDMPAPFRQRRYFYYLSGCDEPNCFLTYDIGRDLLCLFIPRINPDRVIWNGRGSNKAEALDKYDVDTVRWTDELPAYLQEWMSLKKNRNANLFALNAQSRPPVHLNLESMIDYDLLKPAINVSRMVKDDHEIGLIRKANDISSKAHIEVLANICKFKNEAQVEGLFMDVCISQQAKQQAYDPIAASGPNAGTLHYDANNEDFEDRQLMCLDAGCEYKLYASDITRTFPLSASWPSQESESIYKLVQTMQESCIKQLAPGVRYLDLHIQAHQIAISGLLQLGILHNGSREEIFNAGTSRAFFPHGLGHHIGLEVHDVGQAELMSVRRGKAVYAQAPSIYPEGYHNPVYDSATCHAPTDPESSHLEEGMVVTVEPGIYFSVYALERFYFPSPKHARYINKDVVQRYLPVGGVRIEDDILITSNSYENLTTAPKGEEMLEIIRNGKSSARDSTRDQIASRRNSVEEDTPRRRAPGISASISEPRLHSLARAATMPAELRQQDSIDFEPSSGPSLFANFRRSMTADEKIQRWRQQPEASVSKPVSMPICGYRTEDVRHMYMNDGRDLGAISKSNCRVAHVPRCRNCAILAQSLNRLRQNLFLSEQGSQKIAAGFSIPGQIDGQLCSAEQRGSPEPQARIIESPRARDPIPSTQIALPHDEPCRIAAMHHNDQNHAVQRGSKHVEFQESRNVEQIAPSKDATIPRRPSKRSAHQDATQCNGCHLNGFVCEKIRGGYTCKRCMSLWLPCLPMVETVHPTSQHTADPFPEQPRRNRRLDASDLRNAEGGETPFQMGEASAPEPMPLYAAFPTFQSSTENIEPPSSALQKATSMFPLMTAELSDRRRSDQVPTYSAGPQQSELPSHIKCNLPTQPQRYPPLPAGWEFARGHGRLALEQARSEALEQRRVIECRRYPLVTRASMPALQSSKPEAFPHQAISPASTEARQRRKDLYNDVAVYVSSNQQTRNMTAAQNRHNMPQTAGADQESAALEAYHEEMERGEQAAREKLVRHRKEWAAQR